MVSLLLLRRGGGFVGIGRSSWRTCADSGSGVW